MFIVVMRKKTVWFEAYDKSCGVCSVMGLGGVIPLASLFFFSLFNSHEVSYPPLYFGDYKQVIC